jgi:hypothetical protein
VPPGDYTVAAGVFDPAGKTLAAAKRAVTVAPTPADFAISPIVVAGAFFPVPNPRPEDAYTFSGYRFVAKGGSPRPEDGLVVRPARLQPGGRPGDEDRERLAHGEAQAEGFPPVDIPQPQDPPVKVPDAKDGTAKGIVTLDVSAVLIETRLGEFLRESPASTRSGSS